MYKVTYQYERKKLIEVSSKDPEAQEIVDWVSYAETSYTFGDLFATYDIPRQHLKAWAFRIVKQSGLVLCVGVPNAVDPKHYTSKGSAITADTPIWLVPVELLSDENGARPNSPYLGSAVVHYFPTEPDSYIRREETQTVERTIYLPDNTPKDDLDIYRNAANCYVREIKKGRGKEKTQPADDHLFLSSSESGLSWDISDICIYILNETDQGFATRQDIMENFGLGSAAMEKMVGETYTEHGKEYTLRYDPENKTYGITAKGLRTDYTEETEIE